MRSKLAYHNIPQNIGILRDVFKFISLGDLPRQMKWIVDDISEVLAVTDVYKLLDAYLHQHKGKDPVVHFYETFLAEYDPKTREKRGVNYTHEPVVSYIVRSIRRILKKYFDKKNGFASPSVTVLDPAAGTLTFLAETARLTVEEFTLKYGEGKIAGFIKNHILKNFYAFKLMMAPYAIGHLKMSFLLEELGYKLQTDDRFKFYLTNTLKMEELTQTELPGMASLSEESHPAGEVKKERPILIILGNPFYSGHSSNIGDWISKKIKTYFQVDGKPLGEKNPKWLQDDYVKFIRFAQWKIDQAGEGILGFIINHSYLDNPTFRGMRQSLMQSFDQIYLLDLHGKSLKKERCPDGSKNENVFYIPHGVAIMHGIKKRGLEKKISHSEIWGQRKNKYKWLNKHDIKNTRWKIIRPKSEFYLFIPRDERLLRQYETYPRITDIFPVNSVEVVTSRDDFVIDSDKDFLIRRTRIFIDEKMPDEIIRQTFKLNDTSKFKLKEARQTVKKDSNWKEAITKILYRPFDERWILYHDALIEHSKKEVMRHMMVGQNLELITRRQMLPNQPCNYVFISKNIISDGAIRSDNRESESIFPLYLFQPQKEDNKKQRKRSSFGSVWMLFEPQTEYIIKRPNLSETFLERLTKEYMKSPSPEEILYYIYAVLYSENYRKRYAEFLKIDFPRIPFTKDIRLFRKIAIHGKRLVELHLFESDDLDNLIADFRVEKMTGLKRSCMKKKGST